MSERTEQHDDAIWHVPLLILAGLTALAGVGIGIAYYRHAIPDPWGTGLLWGLAGASLTFTLARIIHARHVGRRELELLVLGGGLLASQYFLLIAAGIIGMAVVAIVIGELS